MSRSLASCICQNYEETDESFTVCLSSTGEVHSFGSDFPFKEENSDEENEEQEEKEEEEDDEKEEEEEEEGDEVVEVHGCNNNISIRLASFTLNVCMCISVCVCMCVVD